MTDRASQPAAVGPELPSGAHVVLAVSRGLPEAEPTGFVSVPGLVGESQGGALGRVEEFGLRAEVFTEHGPSERGTVVDQYPAAGAAAPTGSDLLVLVSSGPAPRGPVMPLPDVVGLAEPDAIARLGAASLEADVVRVHHPNVPAGVVVAQLPSVSALAAEKPAGRTRWWLLAAIAAVAIVAIAALAATLLLGGNTQQVAVPSLVGVSATSARQAIASAKLRLGSVTAQAGSSAPEDSVLSQVPPAGAKVRSGSVVTIVVAASRPKVAVPQLLGISESDAGRAIAAAGLVGNVSRSYSNSVAVGDVISQDPAASTLVDPGSSVAVSISLGPSATNVNMPDLVGLDQATAQTNAAAPGLTPRVVNQYSSSSAAGIVADQSPPKNQQLAHGAVVAMSVSLGPAPTTAVSVPSVISETSANGNSALAALGLNAVPVQRDGTGLAADTIADQLPRAGAQVPSGQTVIVFVSSGK